VELNILVIDKY